MNFGKQVTVILDLYGSLPRIYYLLSVETGNLNRGIFRTIYFLHRFLNLKIPIYILINCILIELVSRASAQKIFRKRKLCQKLPVICLTSFKTRYNYTVRFSKALYTYFQKYLVQSGVEIILIGAQRVFLNECSDGCYNNA